MGEAEKEQIHFSIFLHFTRSCTNGMVSHKTVNGYDLFFVVVVFPREIFQEMY